MTTPALCIRCKGRLYVDTDILTCRSCGRHAYPSNFRPLIRGLGPAGKRLIRGEARHIKVN